MVRDLQGVAEQVANERLKAKNDLEDRLRVTEDARAEAMRQLSDMQAS